MCLLSPVLLYIIFEITIIAVSGKFLCYFHRWYCRVKWYLLITTIVTLIKAPARYSPHLWKTKESIINIVTVANFRKIRQKCDHENANRVEKNIRNPTRAKTCFLQIWFFSPRLKMRRQGERTLGNMVEFVS